MIQELLTSAASGNLVFVPEFENFLKTLKGLFLLQASNMPTLPPFCFLASVRFFQSYGSSFQISGVPYLASATQAPGTWASSGASGNG